MSMAAGGSPCGRSDSLGAAATAAGRVTSPGRHGRPGLPAAAVIERAGLGSGGGDAWARRKYDFKLERNLTRDLKLGSRTVAQGPTRSAGPRRSGRAIMAWPGSRSRRRPGSVTGCGDRLSPRAQLAAGPG